MRFYSVSGLADNVLLKLMIKRIKRTFAHLCSCLCLIFEKFLKISGKRLKQYF